MSAGQPSVGSGSLSSAADTSAVPRSDGNSSKLASWSAGSAANAATGAPLLSVRGLSVKFGGVVALDNVSFDVSRRSICGLIGPNGAGKTTLFNCLSRLYVPSMGTILFEGEPIDRRAQSDMAHLGIGRTFQNLALFPTMSVRRNVLVGTHSRSKGGFLKEALQLPGVRADERMQLEFVDGLLEFLRLQSVAELPVNVLPFGTRKRVELARALAAKPKLVLLDEPAAGLNHEAVNQLMETIRFIRETFGVAILLVEHHLNLVMRVCDNVVVLNFGKKIAEGHPTVVQRDPEVIRSYLGDFA